MDWLFSAREYTRYQLRAGSPHDVHSPFVFQLLNSVILDQTPYYSFDKIESLRSALLLDKRKIQPTDLGSGKNRDSNRSIRISTIAKRNLLPEKYARLLFRLVNHFQPQKILEMGTSLGITTLYLATPDSSSQVITLEGCDTTADIAEANFKKAGADNIRLIRGEFSDTLSIALEEFNSLDLAFIDGNHLREPTLEYFNACLKHIHPGSLLIFDDIHWSPEMHAAWNEIRSHEKVSLSIDLFRMGLVFFKTGMTRQHFILRF